MDRLLSFALRFRLTNWFRSNGRLLKFSQSAFGDRIPPEVCNRNRGYQGADWLDLFHKEEIDQLFRKFRRNYLVDEMIDFGYIDGLLQSWPAPGTPTFQP